MPTDQRQIKPQRTNETPSPLDTAETHETACTCIYVYRYTDSLRSKSIFLSQNTFFFFSPRYFLRKYLKEKNITAPEIPSETSYLTAHHQVHIMCPWWTPGQEDSIASEGA